MQKYPITSKNGNEYLVDVYLAHFNYTDHWCADIYIKNPKPKTLFNRKEFKKVYEWSTWLLVDFYKYKYKETAIYAIESYEKTIQAKIDQETFIKAEEEKWNSWDGIIN